MPAGHLDLGLKPLVPDEERETVSAAPSPGRRLDLGNGPPSPPMRTGLASPSSGGRTWYCKWCGMNSEDSNTCTWCRRDLRSTATATGKAAHITVTHGPARGKPVRQPMGREKPKEKRNDKGRKDPLPDLLRESEKAKQNGNGLPKAAPAIGSFQASKSKYYSDQVYDPVSGAHYNADSGKTTDTPVEPKEQVEGNDYRQLAIYMAAFVFILGGVALCGGPASNSAGIYFVVLGIASFIAGILLPVLRVAQFPKDDSEDVGWAMGLIPLFGPFAGTMGYGVLGVVRQDVNPAILGVFITSLLIRVVLDIATGHSLSKLVPFSEMSGMVLGAQLMPFVTLAGWYASEVFHKPDE